MSIQSNINQAMSIAGLLYTQSPGVKLRADAKRLQSTAIASEKKLGDLYNNINELKEDKRDPYSETEISDIEARIPQLNKQIYDYKIAQADPELKKYFKKDNLMKRKDRSNMLSELEGFRQQNNSRIERVQMAKQKAAQSNQAKKLELQASKTFIPMMDSHWVEGGIDG